MFGMDSQHWMALQAIHGVVHSANVGLKYTWFGPGYISNVYFKMISGKKTYLPNQHGGDLSFTSCSHGKGAPIPIHEVAYGDKKGDPVVQTGW